LQTSAEQLAKAAEPAKIIACIMIVASTGSVPANQPVSGGEATDRFKSFRRKMADCPS